MSLNTPVPSPNYRVTFRVGSGWIDCPLLLFVHYRRTMLDGEPTGRLGEILLGF